MKSSSTKLINVILGILGILIIGILICNSLGKSVNLADLLQYFGGFLISVGFLAQGLVEPDAWYSLILFQLGAAFYIIPICLKQFENPTVFSSAFAAMVALIIGLILFDSVKRIVLHFKTAQHE